MNKAILVGRLTRDPELRVTSTQISVTNLTIAVNRNYTNQDGSREADFINCVAYKKLAENISKYTKKGSLVSIFGRIQTRSWDDANGNKRFATEVIIEEILFLSNASSQAGDKNNDIVTNKDTEDPFKNFGDEVVLSDDDLPF